MRKNLTIPCNFYLQSKKLNGEERLEFFDTIFDLFFNDKAFNFSKIKNEKVSILLSCLAPEIRKIQAKYDSGKTTKKQKNDKIKSCKNTKNLDNFFCEKNKSETKQNLASESKTPSDIIKSDTIINNNNKKINNFGLSDAEPDEDKLIISDEFNSALIKLDSLLGSHFSWFFDSLCYLSSQDNILINGNIVPANAVLEKIESMACDEKSHIKILEKYRIFDSLGVPKTKIKYQISSLYNLALELERTKCTNLNQNTYFTNYIRPQKSEANKEIITHNYTAEQLNSVFDDIDTVEI